MDISGKQTEYMIKKAKNFLNGDGEDIQYRRKKHRFFDSRDIAGNNKVAQKAIREYYGLKK
ncbi:hypothetical protein ABE132_14420 [Peribacillus simplex]|uniref:hypothetical protein n=1 Tax=Peribacillus simplex TaxID=1478 RepID=UPI003D2787BB